MIGSNDDRRNDETGEGWENPAEDRLETDQLELTEAEERLPWLESAEDEDYGYDEGYDTGRVVRLALLALVALVAIVGGIWWANNRTPDPELVADGSTVPAPAEPYKTAPKDPGGKTFDGTGDSSFAVSEGQNRPAQLGGAAAAGAPTPAAPAPGAAPKAGPTPVAAAGGGVGVQVGAFSSQASAEAGWAKLVGQAGGALTGVSHRVVAGTADNGTIYRLQAVAPDSAAANALCGKLKAAGIACQVK